MGHMYIHLGQDIVINDRKLIGIFDIDKCSISKITREYLTKAQKADKVVNVSYEIPKSFVVCKEDDGKIVVYISPISCQTLKKRAEFGNLLK